jgi:hypothetical protein
VAPAILRVALAGDEIFGLERVQQRDEDARVDAHRLHELALCESAVVVQQTEDLELAGLEAVGRVGGTKSAHRFMAYERQ